MAFVPARGARDVLADSKGVLRFEEIQAESNVGELYLRQEIDDLVLSGQVERFPVGDHIIIKQTDAFEGGETDTVIRDTNGGGWKVAQ